MEIIWLRRAVNDLVALRRYIGKDNPDAAYRISVRLLEAVERLEVGSRLLLFGTDSVEFIATWLGAVRAGIVPVGVSDSYKAPMLR